MKNLFAYVLALFLMVSLGSVNAFAYTSANDNASVSLVKHDDGEKKGDKKKKKKKGCCSKEKADKCEKGKKKGCCKGKAEDAEM